MCNFTVHVIGWEIYNGITYPVSHYKFLLVRPVNRRRECLDFGLCLVQGILPVENLYDSLFQNEF
jgi:hypothetical protein